MRNRDGSIDTVFFLTLWMGLCFAFPGRFSLYEARTQIPPPDSFSVRSNDLIANTLLTSNDSALQPHADAEELSRLIGVNRADAISFLEHRC